MDGDGRRHVLAEAQFYEGTGRCQATRSYFFSFSDNSFVSAVGSLLVPRSEPVPYSSKFSARIIPYFRKVISVLRKLI